MVHVNRLSYISTQPTQLFSSSLRPLFIPEIFLGGGIPPKLTTRQTAAKLCALNLFFSVGTLNYKYITETFFYSTTNAGNYSAIKQSKGCSIEGVLENEMAARIWLEEGHKTTSK